MVQQAQEHDGRLFSGIKVGESQDLAGRLAGYKLSGPLKAVNNVIGSSSLDISHGIVLECTECTMLLLVLTVI